MKAGYEGAWGPQEFPTEKQRWNFLEKIYADYNEVNLQQEEIATRKREMMEQLPWGNKDEIHQVLFSDNRSNLSPVGNWETYEKVEQIVKKFVYFRGKNIFDPAKPDAVFSERIEILTNTSAEQKLRIASLEKSLASAYDELAGLMALLQMKDKEIKKIKMRTHVELLTAAHTQRVLEKAEATPSTANQNNIYKDMSTLIEINKKMERENARLCAALNVKLSLSSHGAKALVSKRKKLSGHTVSQEDNTAAVTTACTNKQIIGESKLDNSHISGSSPRSDIKAVDSKRMTCHVACSSLPEETDAMEKTDDRPNTGVEFAGADSLQENEDHITKSVTFVYLKKINNEEDETPAWNDVTSKSMEHFEESVNLGNFCKNNWRKNSDVFARSNTSMTAVSTVFDELSSNEAIENLADSSSRIQYILEKAPITALLVRLYEEREKWELQLEAEVAHNISCRDHDAYAERVLKHDVECGSDGESIQNLWVSQNGILHKNGSHVSFVVDDISRANLKAENLPLDDNYKTTIPVDDNVEPVEMYDDKKSSVELSTENLPLDDNYKTTIPVDDNVESVEMYDNRKGGAYSSTEDLSLAQNEEKDRFFCAADSQMLVFKNKLSSKNMSQSAGADECHRVATLHAHPVGELSPSNPRREDVTKTTPGHSSIFQCEASSVENADGADKARVKKRTPNIGRHTTDSFVEAGRIARSLKNEMVTLKKSQNMLSREMNEFFYNMGQLIDALQTKNEKLEDSIQMESEALASGIAEDVVKEMVQKRLFEEFEKFGIDLQRYPGPSSGLTDEEWLHNQLYDFIFRSSRNDIAKKILSGHNKNDVRTEVKPNLEGGFLLPEHTAQVPKESLRKNKAETKKVNSFLKDKSNKEKMFNDDFRRAPACSSASVASENKVWPLFAPVSPRGGGLDDANASSWQTGTPVTSINVPHNYLDAGEAGISPFGSSGSVGEKKWYDEKEFFAGDFFQEHPYEMKESLQTGHCTRVWSEKANFPNPVDKSPLQGQSRSRSFTVAKAPPGEFKGNLLKYLQSLRSKVKPESVHNMGPTVHQCFPLKPFERARYNAQRILRSATAWLQGAEFENVFRSNILPYAVTAKSMQNGRRVAPWILSAIRHLRVEERKRNERLRRIIFQRVVTNIRARRMVGKSVCKGSPIASFVVILWKRWLENTKKEHATLRLEKEADLNRMLDLISANLLNRSQAGQYVKVKDNMKNPLLDPSSSHFSSVRLPFKHM